MTETPTTTSPNTNTTTNNSHHNNFSSSSNNSLLMTESWIEEKDVSMQDVPISPAKLPKLRSVMHPRMSTLPPPYEHPPSSLTSPRPSTPIANDTYDHGYDCCDSEDSDTVVLEHFRPLAIDASTPAIEYCHDTDAEDYRGGPCQPRKKKDPKEKFQVGDHVYRWRSWAGIPGVFQHHGIVMDIINDPNTGEFKWTIANFSNVEPRGDKNANCKSKTEEKTKPKLESRVFQEGIMSTYTDISKWHKVVYEAGWWKRTYYRAGTCTSVKPNAVGMTLARVNFIIQYPELLPDYHAIYANCECVAFWCKTGEWSTLQASSLLEMAAAGQAKQSATLAMTAASTQVSVPASGVWGWMGYTSSVSWLSLHPIVVPALAGYAAVTIGGPAVIYYKAKGRWEQTTKRLCDSFWESAMEQPDVFAECMARWSEKNII